MGAREALIVATARIDYVAAWEVQRRLADARRADIIPDVLWLLEHPPVFTTGRHGTRADLYVSDEQLQRMGATFHEVDRGGQMTWHGPGQTTAYVIANLRPGGRVRGFVEALVGAMSDAAGVPGTAGDAGAMGLYREGRKLGSVGIRVIGGVTMHGLALNRDPDLGWFSLMTACGAPDTPASSIAAEGGDPDRARVEGGLADALAERLGLRLRPAEIDDLPLPVPAP